MLITGEEAKISKKQIHQRLVKRAAKLWGIHPQDIDNFDPLINLLLEVFAEEYARIGQEITTSNGRVLEVLSEILVPDKVFTPVPAHGLAQLDVLEPYSMVNPGDVFSASVNLSDPKNPGEGTANLHFTTLSKFKLVRATIPYLVLGNNVLLKERAKAGYHFNDVPKTGITDHFHIGISVEEGLENLENAVFCLDYKQDKDSVWERMSELIKWTDSSGNIIPICKYFKEENLGYSGGRNKDLEEVITNIKFAYEDRLFMANTGLDISKIKGVPQFAKELADQLKEENLYWIKVKFPFPQPLAIFENLDVHFNVVPLVNVRKTELIYRLNDFLNIVPIQTEGKLLCIENIYNNAQNEFVLKNNYNARELEKGTYIIRHSGIKRFDKRNASQVLDHLLDLLRDEIAAFSGLHDDHFMSILKQIKQLTAQLENKVSDKLDGRDEIPFLFVNPFSEGETLYINYWTTDGEVANKIGRGTTIESLTNLSISPSENKFLTPVRCGRNKLFRDEKLYALKRALISRNRVVTREDLKALSFEVMGTLLKSVEIKEGIGMNPQINGGYTRVIQLYLTPNTVENEEWELLLLKLKKRVETESFFVIPVEIKTVKQLAV